MTFRPLFICGGLTLSLALTACGGGSFEPTSTSSWEAVSPEVPPVIRRSWDRHTLEFGTASVGSTSIREVVLTNIGSQFRDYSKFIGLPAGVSAKGCTNVAPDASCTVVFSYTPQDIGEVAGTVNAVGDLDSETMWVEATAVDASLQTLTRFMSDSGDVFWTGALNIRDNNQVLTVLKDVRITRSEDGRSDTCSVTVQGSYPTELAGRLFQFGATAFYLPAEGKVSTVDNETSTTFEQPYLTMDAHMPKCYTITAMPYSATEEVHLY